MATNPYATRSRSNPWLLIGWLCLVGGLAYTYIWTL